MESPRNLVRPAACVVLAALIGGASLPSPMTGPGNWEISKSASGSGAERLCLADAALMLQWEHRAKQCTRVVISSSSDRAEVHYTCVGGGFGTSRIQVLTPRSVKVDTQGISDGFPFAYVLHARRSGPCQPH